MRRTQIFRYHAGPTWPCSWKGSSAACGVYARARRLSFTSHNATMLSVTAPRSESGCREGQCQLRNVEFLVHGLVSQTRKRAGISKLPGRNGCGEQSVKNVSTEKAVVHHRGNSSQYSVAFGSTGCLKLHRQHFATKSNDTCSDAVNYRILRCTRIPAATHTNPLTIHHIWHYSHLRQKCIGLR